MTGHFFDPDSEEGRHTCDTPWMVGSGHWRCECGKAWQVRWHAGAEPWGWVRDPTRDKFDPTKEDNHVDP